MELAPISPSSRTVNTINVSNIQFSGPEDEWPNILDQVPNDVSLFPHQVDSVKWLYERERGIIPGAGGNILGDVMGLGKTITTVTLLSLNPLRRTLIVCSKSLICQWVRELLSQNHTVYFLEPACARTVGLFNGKVVFGKEKLEHDSLKVPYVAVTSYGKVKPFPEPVHDIEKVDSAYHCAEVGSECETELIPFRRIVWSRIVIDEVHTLRNGVSLNGDKTAQLRKKCLKYYRMLRLRHTRNVKILGLTGTPLQNRIGDLASVFLFLGLYISRMTSEEDLAAYIKTNMFRRNASNLHPKTKELIRFPTEPYNEVKVTVEYDTIEEKNFYIMAAGRLEEHLRCAMGEYKNVKSEQCMLTLLTLLRLLSSHPAAFVKAYNNRYEEKIPKWKGNVSKLSMIEKQLSDYHKSGQSCIVFVHFYEEAERIYSLDTGYKHVEFLNGSISCEDRDYVCHKSKRIISRGGTFLILANIIACGEGLNLQHFSNVIIHSPDWNPSAEEQSIARVYRIGSAGTVNVTRYYHKEITDAVGTLNIDKFMKDKQEEKKIIAARMIDNTPNASWSYQVTKIPGYDLPSTIYPTVPIQNEFSRLDDSPNRTRPPGRKSKRAKAAGKKSMKETSVEEEANTKPGTVSEPVVTEQHLERTELMKTYNKNFVVIGSKSQYNCLRLSVEELTSISNGSDMDATQVKAILSDEEFWLVRARLDKLRLKA